jgi:hypothetical protein
MEWPREVGVGFVLMRGRGDSVWGCFGCKGEGAEDAADFWWAKMEEWLLRGKELWVLVSGWGREDEQEKMARRGEDGRGRGGLSPAGLGQKNPSRGGGDCFGEDERKGRGALLLGKRWV